MTITATEYTGFQAAYDALNAALFDGQLPHVLVTLQRRGRSRGYFSPDRFEARDERCDARRDERPDDAPALGAEAAHELALNPDSFAGRTDEEICSTLAHEMAHVWQQVFGTPGRGGYHNKEWAAKMHAIGLTPSTTAEPGGKEIGQRVSHYITPGGRYAAAYAALYASGYRLHWQSRVATDAAAAARATKAASKTKYTCPECGMNAWGKPDAVLLCGSCYVAEDGTGVMQPAA